MPFAGDALALGAYMIPRPVLELLQQPVQRPQAGICAEAGFCWVLSGPHLHVWRYADGKDARLRVLTLPRPPPPGQPCHVALIAHGPSGGSGGAISVAVCTAGGHLTVWLDAHHLAYPSEQQVLAPPRSQQAQRLVTAFAATRLDLGGGPAFLAAMGTVDGSWHLLQAGPQGIFAKQLACPPAAPASEAKGLVGALGSALSKAYTDAFDPSAKYLRRAPSQRAALGVSVEAVAGGGGQHFRVLLLTDEGIDCWLVGGWVGARTKEREAGTWLVGVLFEGGGWGEGDCTEVVGEGKRGQEPREGRGNEGACAAPGGGEGGGRGEGRMGHTGEGNACRKAAVVPGGRGRGRRVEGEAGGPWGHAPSSLLLAPLVTRRPQEAQRPHLSLSFACSVSPARHARLNIP